MPGQAHPHRASNGRRASPARRPLGGKAADGREAFVSGVSGTYSCRVGRQHSVASVVFPAILLVAAATGAQNLVANPDFGSGIAGWHLVGRGALTHSADGGMAPGSLEAAGGLAGNATQAVAGQCLSGASPGQLLDFRVRLRVVSGSPSYCRVALFESERDDCRWIALGAELRRTTFSGGWDLLSGGSLPIAAGTRSIELRLHCATAAGDLDPLVVRFDDVSVTRGGFVSEIFSDGFELGNTSRWSSTFP